MDLKKWWSNLVGGGRSAEQRAAPPTPPPPPAPTEVDAEEYQRKYRAELEDEGHHRDDPGTDGLPDAEKPS